MSVVFGKGCYYVVAANGCALYSAKSKAAAMRLMKEAVRG